MKSTGRCLGDIIKLKFSSLTAALRRVHETACKGVPAGTCRRYKQEVKFYFSITVFDLEFNLPPLNPSRCCVIKTINAL